MYQSRVLSFVRNGLIAILHTLLLVPVFFFFMEINRVPNEQAFFTFFIVTQLLAVILYKWWVFLPVQFLHILYRLYSLFPPLDNTLTIREWLREMGSTVLSQLTALLQADLVDVPELLIFTLLFVLSSLLTTLAVHNKWALPSFLIPFSYLMILHTFTDNRVLSHMVLLVGVGFLFIGLTKISTDMHWTDFFKNIALTSLITFALVSFSSWGIDRFRSSQEWLEIQFYPYQRTLDDNGFFNWINTYSTGLGYQRTGFGLDDSVLGGPLHQDFTPLFRAYTEDPNYWKVLHRTEYTGNGWEDNNDEYPRSLSEPQNSQWMYEGLYMTSEGIYAGVDFSDTTIEWHTSVDYIAYPYGWSTFELEDVSSNYLFIIHERSAYYTIPSDSEDITRYTVSYDEQFSERFNEEQLSLDDGWRQEMNDSHNDLIENDVYEDLVASIFEKELQLPDSLPQRVTDLAFEITEGLENEYDMVRAIENYLKADGGYRYSLLEVESTPEGNDYVDYFLFESLIGYCDNFSSAMTLLLRTLGIPARWTKGFTPGDYHENESNDAYYQVSNANAHSWVEVYFPSFGWIPFEPSPSFANPVTNPEPVTSVSQESYIVEEDDFIDLEEIDDVIDPLVEEDASEEPEGTEELKGTPELIPQLTEVDEYEESFSIDWSTLILSVLLLGFVSLFLFLLFRWKTFNWTLKQLVAKSQLSLEKAVQLILFLFKWKKKRQPGQTIDAYLNQWKPFLANDTETIDQFVTLANVSFYSSNQAKETITKDQKKVILKMIDLYKKAPNLKKSKHDSTSLR